MPEQLFASLYSVKNEEWYSFLQSEHAISFEIVGRKEDIKFYVSVPHELMELVEKQVHGAYPGKRRSKQWKSRAFLTRMARSPLSHWSRVKPGTQSSHFVIYQQIPCLDHFYS